MSLIAYHLPLDRHQEVGNNAVAARRLHLEDLRPFCELEGLAVGVVGRLPAPMAREEVVAMLGELFEQKPMVFPHGTEQIQTLGLVSGAGGRCFQAAIAEGLDLFVTGEAEEWTLNLAKESRSNFVAAGHYATERLGIQALGEKLQQEFGIEVEFVDLPNPI
jgi:putative NIF3 family GTP cyclohydrolase 1 type 2